MIGSGVGIVGMGACRLNIATKVFALAGAFLTLAAVIAFFLITQANSERREFKTALAEQNLARVAQVTFKVQVQEWKNVLLRGGTQEGFEKYSTSFLKTEKEVLELADSLSKQTQDSVVRAQVGRF